MILRLFENDTLLILLVVFVIVAYKYFTRNKNYWKDRNVPFIPPMFFFGNYFDLLSGKKCTGNLYRDIYNQFPDSRFVGVYQFQRPNLLLRDPDDIKRVMISDFNCFQDRIQFSNPVETLSNHLFNVEGETWRPMRQKISPSFTTGRLKNMFNLIVEVSEEFTRYTNKIVQIGKEVDVRDMCARFTTDVIGSCGFGLNMDSMENVDSEFRKHGASIFDASIARFIIILIILYDVNLFRYFKLRRINKKTSDFFEKIIRDVIKQRENSNAIKRNDFIDLLMELKEKEKNVPDSIVDDKFMACQAYVFFAAGFETSSTLMAFVLYQLAKHPDIQDKVAREIKEVLENHGNKLTYESMFEMPYLDMVISETQRFYPALTTITRICTTPYTFPGSQVKVEKGTNIIVPVLALHFDPKHFTDPDEFFPERFDNDSKKDRHPLSFLPFGEGPRNCIGLRLGKIQSKAGLVTLLKDYVVETSDRTPMNVRIDPKSFVSAPEGLLYLKFAQRY